MVCHLLPFAKVGQKCEHEYASFNLRILLGSYFHVDKSYRNILNEVSVYFYYDQVNSYTL